MSVSKTRLFIFTEPVESVVPLPCRAGFVLPSAVDHSEDGQGEDEELRDEVDRVTSVIRWRICGNIGPSVTLLVNTKSQSWLYNDVKVCVKTYVATRPPMVPSVTT